MSLKSLLIFMSMLAVVPASTLYAQEEGSDGGRDRGSNQAVGRAVERSAPAPAPARPAREAPPPRVAPAAALPPAEAAPAAAEQRRQNGGNGGRDRADNPATGRAVPRGGEARPAPGPGPTQQRQGGRAVERQGRVVARPPVVRGGRTNIYVAPRNYYYTPRRYYPYGYGAFGLGYFYYDPYTWYPPSYYSGSSYYGDPYYGRYPGGFFEGELRIDVSPRFAEVYVDGYFAGRVDDFDGVFQGLRLEEGAHHIQIVAQGFAPLDFDVRIDEGRKITYRGQLQPYRP